MLYLLLLLISTCYSSRCITTEDCVHIDKYCQGPYKCNRSSAQCVPQYPRYNPCRVYQHQVERFMMESRNREYTMSVICSNEVKACVEVYYCMNDRDCDDGLYCNGKERCVEGVCKQQQTASPCTECDEATKCGDTTIHSSALNDSDTSLEGAEPATDPTLIYVLIVGVVIIGGIVVVVLLINIYNWTKRSVY